ncbi:cytochrome P450 [Aspergillus ibericus CBS 121593]|uniref:Cytochrome P450 n=1 Tax=Aspergillus ibericus CBS 121593 TaxID=1448316 RepID=A0A395GK56_9EURO|nr:cytochrome P450 [Aspergillus ibericus CBS 121593]RAK95672.1 cytochrome P450 [Aspergillus ibericus CBS 121593]
MAVSGDLFELVRHNGPLLAVAGVSAHLFYWIRGERGSKAARLWLCLNLLVNTATLVSTTNNQGSWCSNAWLFSIAAVSVLNLCFYIPLFTSVLIYRAFFHRLHQFPGPFSLKVSKFVSAYQNIEKGRNFERLWNLHQHYGDIVRTGPQELSVLSAEAIDTIYGPSSRCTRAPWYDRLKTKGDFTQDYAVFHMRDPAAHAQRRKALWDKAFNIRALKAYQPMVVQTTQKFLDALSCRSNQILSGPGTMELLSYDLMGVVGWGHSFRNTENWKLNSNLHFVKALTAGQRILSQVPWLISLLVSLPGSDGPLRPYGTWIQDRIQEKLQKSDESDAMSRMLPSMLKLSKPALYSEGELLVIAGGDTTSTTISTVIFHLARNPALQRKLQAELDAAHTTQLQTTEPPESDYYRSISTLPYLNACITEALRILPSVLGVIPRLTPPEGIHLPLATGRTFIPGNTVISVPVFPVQHDPRYYRHPDEFVPERWTDEKPDWTMNKAAFMPFGGGPYMCAGRGLAYIELRVVLAMLFRRFDVRLAEGEDGRRFLEETKDCQIAHLGDFRVVFNLRDEK